MVGVSYLVLHSKTERLQEALGGGGPVRASREGQEGTNCIEQACQTDWVVPRLVLWFTVMAQLLFGCSPLWHQARCRWQTQWSHHQANPGTEKEQVSPYRLGNILPSTCAI